MHNTKNPGKAWRYNDGAIDPIEQNDVSVTGWMVMCLASDPVMEQRPSFILITSTMKRRNVMPFERHNSIARSAGY